MADRARGSGRSAPTLADGCRALRGGAGAAARRRGGRRRRGAGSSSASRACAASRTRGGNIAALAEAERLGGGRRATPCSPPTRASSAGCSTAWASTSAGVSRCWRRASPPWTCPRPPTSRGCSPCRRTATRWTAIADGASWRSGTRRAAIRAGDRPRRGDPRRSARPRRRAGWLDGRRLLRPRVGLCRARQAGGGGADVRKARAAFLRHRAPDDGGLGHLLRIRAGHLPVPGGSPAGAATARRRGGDDVADRWRPRRSRRTMDLVLCWTWAVQGRWDDLCRFADLNLA